MPTAPPVRLSPADRRRLQVAAGHSVDPTRSLFGPHSITWRINGEGVILLGGGCALLLQVAHPLVAAGVAAHSRYREEPLQRLWRTLELMLTIVFADARQAIAAVRAIERVHRRVRGQLDEAAGPFARGTPYRANDPDLLLWVHATLVDTALRVYERFVTALTDGDKAAYYEESKITGRLFGIPPGRLPRTFDDFQRYMRRMLNGDVLAVGGASRAIAASILSPPLPLGLKQMFQIPNVVTIGLLPPVLRKRYGYAWSAGHEALLSAAATVARLAIPLLPNVVRILPAARRA